MNTSLLLKLADLLDTVPDHLFAYSSWIGGNRRGAVGECGTTACALGWATTIPEAQLEIRRLTNGPPLARALGETIALSVMSKNTANGRLEGIEAAEEAFGLSFADAEALFLPAVYYERLARYSPSGYAKAKEVAAWIRDVVAAHVAAEGTESP